MGYFFDSIQRAAGINPVNPEVAEQAAEQTLPLATTHSGASAAAAAVQSAQAPATPSPVKRVQHVEFWPDVVVTAKSLISKEDIPWIEQFRGLRVRLVEASRNRPMRTILVTSSVEGEGKTAVSMNLAVAFSKMQHRRTLLVDGDLRRATLAARLGVTATPGMSDYLSGNASFEEVICEVMPNLDVVVGNATDRAPELLQSPRLQTFIKKASAEYELVIFDTPPLCSVADTEVLAGFTDAIIFVVRANNTERHLVEDAIGKVKNKVVGSVLNFVERLPNRSYYYPYDADKS